MIGLTLWVSTWPQLVRCWFHILRARAQSLGYEAKVGILTRAERYAVLAPTLIFNIPWLGVWIIAVLANITAMQRIIHVRRLAHVKMDEKKSE